MMSVVLSVLTVARSGCGGLSMAKHRQNKGTKKHVKNRPRKVRETPTQVIRTIFTSCFRLMEKVLFIVSHVPYAVKPRCF